MSEVVTNALLHAGTDIVLRLETTGNRVRVEVWDASPLPPSMRHYGDSALTGRGLGLVDALAAAWGIRSESEGKTVWFELASGEAGRRAGPPRLSSDESRSGSQRLGSDRPTAARPIRLERAPVRLLWATVQYGDSLLREAALMAIEESSAGAPMAWRAPAVDLSPLLEHIEAALHDEVDVVDVVAAFPPDCADAVVRRLAVIDEADRMAHEGLLLGPPALPEVAACRRWYLGEIARQLQGEAPLPWELPTDTAASRTAPLGAAQREAVERLGTAAVVADDANRIVYVTEQAAHVLGWTVADLTGQRLTVIVPPALRDAHLAGFTRYRVTGSTRVIGRDLELPALRRDGSVVQVQLRISVLEGPDRGLLVGELRPSA